MQRALTSPAIMGASLLLAVAGPALVHFQGGGSASAGPDLVIPLWAATLAAGVLMALVWCSWITLGLEESNSQLEEQRRELRGIPQNPTGVMGAASLREWVFSPAWGQRGPSLSSDGVMRDWEGRRSYHRPGASAALRQAHEETRRRQWEHFVKSELEPYMTRPLGKSVVDVAESRVLSYFPWLDDRPLGSHSSQELADPEGLITVSPSPPEVFSRLGCREALRFELKPEKQGVTTAFSGCEAAPLPVVAAQTTGVSCRHAMPPEVSAGSRSGPAAAASSTCSRLFAAKRSRVLPRLPPEVAGEINQFLGDPSRDATGGALARAMREETRRQQWDKFLFEKLLPGIRSTGAPCWSCDVRLIRHYITWAGGCNWGTDHGLDPAFADFVREDGFDLRRKHNFYEFHLIPSTPPGTPPRLLRQTSA